MKHGISYITAIILSVWILSFSSCEIETHSKGNIDGNWHLVEIDTLDTGGINDFRDFRVFWGIQANLVQLRDNDIVDNPLIIRFDLTNDRFTLYKPHINDRENNDPEITDVSLLSHYGINELYESFLVEKLSATNLTLKSAKLRLFFEKF